MEGWAQPGSTAAGLDPRPSVLLNLFNSRYWGRSVTFQAVSRWLKGEAIPAQDKLVVLAELLRVEPSVLRFGVQTQARLQARERRWEEGVGYTERETFEAFLNEPARAATQTGRGHHPGLRRPVR